MQPMSTFTQRYPFQDLCPDNVVIVTSSCAKRHSTLKPKRIYIIDFGQSIQLQLGPGRQPAIDLPASQEKKPPGMGHFDPYSWDMYCVGKLFEIHLEVDLHHCIVHWKCADAHL